MTVSERFISLGIVAILGNMVFLSSAPVGAKIAIVCALFGIAWYYTLARLWVWWVFAGIAILSFFFGMDNNPVAMFIMMFNMIGVAFVWTLSMHIPRNYIATGFIISLCFAYLTVFFTMAMLSLDPFGCAATLMLLFLAWVAWLDSYPANARFGID